MNLLSLVFAVIGTITTLVHYTNHAISMGVFSFILLLASFVLGTVGMKKQEKTAVSRQRCLTLQCSVMGFPLWC